VLGPRDSAAAVRGAGDAGRRVLAGGPVDGGVDSHFAIQARKSDDAACLRRPLYATRFHEGFGTLYTAECRPAESRALSLACVAWEHSLDKLGQDSIRTDLGTT
jgi:hypothetical protein